MGHHIEEKKRIEQPKRVAYAIKELNRLGYEVVQVDSTTLRFNYCGAVITVLPYTGWIYLRQSFDYRHRRGGGNSR